MAAWLFTTAAWMLVLAGVFVAWRFGWHDPGKGTRRCSRCWYDMSATAGLKCSECGNLAKRDSGLFRRRTRWLWFGVAAMVAALADPVSRGPEIQRDGLVGALPRPVVLYTWPSLLRHSTQRTELGRWLNSPALHRRINAELAATPAWWEIGMMRSAAVSVLRSPRNQTSERYAEAALNTLGEDMGEGAAALVDLFVADTGRRSTGKPDTSLFFRLPNRGRNQIDRVVQAVNTNPNILNRDPAIVPWIADRTGSLRSILPSIAAAPRGNPMDALRFRLDLWGVTRYRAEEIPELSAALSRQAGIADKGIPETMASARPAAAPLVSEFRRLLRADAEDSKINVLLALCRCGAGFLELVPEIEALLTNATPEVREVALIALAVVTCQPEVIEDRVFAGASRDATDFATWRGTDPQAAIGALTSGLWPREVAAPLLARHLSSVDDRLAATEIRAMEYLLASPESVREYRDLLVDQFSRRWILANQFVLHIEQFPESAAELVPVLRACEQRAEGKQRMMFRSAREEVQRMAAMNVAAR